MGGMGLVVFLLDWFLLLLSFLFIVLLLGDELLMLGEKSLLKKERKKGSETCVVVVGVWCGTVLCTYRARVCIVRTCAWVGLVA